MSMPSGSPAGSGPPAARYALNLPLSSTPRVNGALRDRLNALTRKTHAFAKRDATWDALVSLQLFEHNWIRPHRALRLLMSTEPRRYLPHTPAMPLALTVHPWSWISFLTTSLSTTSK